MKKVTHPNCVHLHEVFDEPNKTYLILDLYEQSSRPLFSFPTPHPLALPLHTIAHPSTLYLTLPKLADPLRTQHHWRHCDGSYHRHRPLQ
jgi:hypothetical protein